MYDRTTASIYDDLYPKDESVQPITDFLLRDLASALGTSRVAPEVLELGVGTGRIAIPLAVAGVKVFGVDNSKFMLDQLKDASLRAGVQDSVISYEGDICETQLDRRFPIVYCACATLSMLPPSRQREAIHQAIQHLAPSGHLIVESLSRTGVEHLMAGRPAAVFMKNYPNLGHVVFSNWTEDRSDPSSWNVEHVLLKSDRQSSVVEQSWPISPPELDKMAQDCGLTPEQCLADWDGSKFEPTSRKFISTYSNRSWVDVCH